MSYLYVCEQGAVISFEGSRFQVKYKDGMLKSIPSETLEMIQIFGKVQLTTQCIAECLQRGICVVFYSAYGAYFGRLVSTGHVNVARQRMQAALTEDFKLELSKNIIKAKIQNQAVILRRYARYRDYDATQDINQMVHFSHRLQSCTSVEEIMGYEGAAARYYFSAIGNLIDPAFHFEKRTRRPPLDPFNSMISLGYSVVLNEIYGKLEGKGLNPYFGVLHQDREKHPTLASDLMEEWRPVLIDSLTLSLLNGHEITENDFYRRENDPGVYLEKQGFKTYITKLEDKFHSENKYIPYVDYAVSFRRAMDLQINRLCSAIENGDPGLYKPVQIR